MRIRHLGAAWPLAAAALAAAAPPEPELQLRSCVRDTPPLRVPARAAQVRLDEGDRDQFHHAAAARYPLYQRGGFVPPAVWLIQRDGRWQYVTLWHDGGRGPCFTAVFAAERFDFTARWLAKYRPREADPSD
ncbi:MAG: hypothetical protein JNM08_13775 [Rubrivivax sp.]|nr:hypothetical protein [Rubrivivax sp.]